MGSGGIGGGGGGGGGGGSGLYSKGRHHIRLRGSTTKKQAPQTQSSSDQFTEVLAKLRKNSKTYLQKQFTNEMLANLYAELALFSQDMQNQSWSGITKRWKIPDGPGCLLEYTNVLSKQFGQSESDEKVRQTARTAFENFIFKMIGDDYNVFVSGTGDQVVKTFDRGAYDKIDRGFLDSLVSHLVTRDKEMDPEKRKALDKFSADKANALVNKFMHKFNGHTIDGKQISRLDLFYIVKKNYDWFEKELLKE